MIEWFRRMEEAKDTPIVIITGGDTAKFRDRALAAGAADFFQKPINNDELLASIQRILSERKASVVTQA
jgi:DNA-binding response OmpR family regulator